MIPKLSIGLPVYNGEQFLPFAIESILAQTFTDFELVISDNASDDGTRDICETFASQDKRIRYHRNETNIGATQNWYLVHKVSKARYFASAAHDDVYEPDYMRACLEVLERDPGVAVCHSRFMAIDERGETIGPIDITCDTTSPLVHERLRALLSVDYMCLQLYGVMRSEILGRVQEFQGYYMADWNTLAELCLLGKIVEIPEVLFRHRRSSGKLGDIVHSGKSVTEMSEIDPGTDWSIRRPDDIRWRNYFGSVKRLVPRSIDRLNCYRVLAQLYARHRIIPRVKARIRRLASASSGT